MTNYSFSYDKKVHVLTYEPTAAALQAILLQHDAQTDTDLAEWTVDIQKVANEVTHTMQTWQNRYRWEITLTRRIK